MNEHIEKLTEKAEDFFEDAKYLFQGKRFEAVINRCYYAMFTMVQALLLSKNIFSKTHHGTMIKFHEQFIKTAFLPVELGKILNETFEKRQFTDYDVDADITEGEAGNMLENTDFFISALKNYLTSPTAD